MSQAITAGDGLRVLSDEPCVSSASLCTTLNLVKDRFRPDYTHQCLSDEAYAGHCPLETAMQEKNHSLFHADTYLHKSHRQHSHASYSLDVQIQLAPSCRKCRVDVHRSPRPAIEEKPTVNLPSAKKPRMMEPMTDDDIRNSIAKALPAIISKSDDCQDDYITDPIGNILTEYSCERHGKMQDFIVTVADGRDVVDYHSEVQRLALWFIENADDVDIANDQSGFWKVVYLFQKHTNDEIEGCKYSLVGYMTQFHFNAPFHKPTPGIIARICQALVFPPYQGQGHGSKMMRCVYDMAHGKYPDVCCADGPAVVQVNVEDPSPGFTLLRNTFDYRFLTCPDNLPWWPNTSAASKLLSCPSKVVAESIFQGKEACKALSQEEVLQFSSKAKILPRQVQIVNELVHLCWIQAGKYGEDLQKKFRVMVKKRLNREHWEEMSEYPTKEEKKAYLAKLYEEIVEPYKEWFRKRQLHAETQDKRPSNLPVDIAERKEQAHPSHNS